MAGSIPAAMRSDGHGVTVGRCLASESRWCHTDACQQLSARSLRAGRHVASTGTLVAMARAAATLQ